MILARAGWPPRLPSLLAILAGASGLCHELLWARLLAIEVGSAQAALTILVAAVTLGLALGAARLGSAADRTGHPLRIFALCQTGAAALGLVSALASWRGGLARPLLSNLGLDPGSAFFLLVIVATYGAFACAASFLMGGTIPLLLKASSGVESFGRRAGRLAAWNAGGAAAGALATGFLLLPGAGLRASLIVAASLSMLAALLAASAPGWKLPRRDRERSASGAAPAVAAHGPLPRGVLAALLASGAAVTALEVGWTRVAFYCFGSSAQAGSLVLTAIITGLAIGSAFGARARGPHPARSLSLLLSGGALAIAVTDPLFGRLPVVAAWLASRLEPAAGGPVEIAFGQVVRFGLIFGLICLPSALLGACFPAGCRALQAARDGTASEGRDAGLASAACAVGNMLGAPIACFVILPLSGSHATLVASAVVMACGAMMVRSTGALRVAAAASLIVVAAAGALLPWDAALMSSGPYLYGELYESAFGGASQETLAGALRARGDLIFSREGPDALVTARRSRDGLLSLQVNGKTDASTGGDLKTQALTAHLPLLLHAAASKPATRVLVIGLGSGITAAAALSHPIGSLHVVEISPEVVEAARLFEEANRGALHDPRITLLIRDARAHLLFGERRPLVVPGGGPPYDVIASQPSNPWVAGQAILFTQEFFSLARERLAPGGLMCQWLQGQGLAPEDFRSIVATFASVFTNVSLWEESTSGGDYLLVGSDRPLAIGASRLADAMARSEVAADLVHIEITSPADLLSHFVAGDDEIDRFTRDATVQTEDRLALEFTAPAAIHRETLGGILRILEPIRTNPARLAGIGASLATDLSRRARIARKEREWAAGLGLLEAPMAGADPDLLRAVSYLKAGMRSHALETVRALALRRPSERVPHLMQAHLLMSLAASAETGAAEGAIRELRTAVTLDPEEPRARLFLSRAIYAAGRIEEAIAENGRIPAPVPAEAASDRCAMLLVAGDSASAEAACLEALSLDADLAEAHANLGVVRSRRGRPDAAEASYRRALDLDPGLIDARFNLAALCERQGRSAEGLSALAPLLDGSQGKAEASTLRLAARLAIQKGDSESARAWIEASLAVEPDSAEAAQMKRLLGLRR